MCLSASSLHGERVQPRFSLSKKTFLQRAATMLHRRGLKLRHNVPKSSLSIFFPPGRPPLSSPASKNLLPSASPPSLALHMLGFRLPPGPFRQRGQQSHPPMGILPLS